jgi:NAD(P)-dependent dehydrogenase (short-subunit alcohol dehydrogenase family)
MNTILITGASSGVGLALAHHLSRRFRVIAAARRLQKMEAAFHGNANISIYALDLTEPASLPASLDAIIREQGPILHVVNNAGVARKAALAGLSAADLQHSLNVNAVAPMMIMQRLLPDMVNNDFGRIINVTSGAPLVCFAGFGAYSASKAALNALTATAAREYAGHNIKINLLSPGPVRSEMAPDASMSPDVCFPTMEYLLDVDESGPTGRFFWLGHEVPLYPDLPGVNWMAGEPSPKMRRIL